MGEISQTKTSIECSLYSPIPAVAAPRAQTPSYTQFNRSSSRHSTKRLLLALLRLICNALLVIVTIPAVHMSCQAMSPSSHCEGHFLVGWACAALHLASVTKCKISCSQFTMYFLSIFFSNCGYSCLLAPPADLSFIMQLFWALSQIFKVIPATPPLSTHTPSLSG